MECLLHANIKKMLVIRGRTLMPQGGNLISGTCIKYPFLLPCQALSSVCCPFRISYQVLFCWSRHAWHSCLRIILLTRSLHVSRASLSSQLIGTGFPSPGESTGSALVFATVITFLSWLTSSTLALTMMPYSSVLCQCIHAEYRA